VEAERAGRFEEEYNRLLPLGLSTYIQGYQLLTNSNADQAKAQLRDFVQRLVATGANDIASALTTLCQAQGTCDIRQELARLGFGESKIAILMQFYEQARDRFYTPEERQQLHSDVCTILQHIPRGDMRVFHVVGALFEAIFKNMHIDPVVHKAIIRVAAQGITNGWQLMALDRVGGPLPFRIVFYHPNFLTTQGPRQTLFLVNFFNVSGFDPNNVIDWISKTIRDWNVRLMAAQRLFGVNANFGLIGAVLVGATSVGQISGMLDALRNAYRNWDGAIFIVWVDSAGRVWFVCIGQGCGLLTSSQQQEVACMLAGRSTDCGATR